MSWMTSATTRPPFHHDGAPHTRQGSGRTAVLHRGVGGDTHTGSLSSVTPSRRLGEDGPDGEVERLFLHHGRHRNQDASAALLDGSVRPERAGPSAAMPRILSRTLPKNVSPNSPPPRLRLRYRAVVPPAGGS